jgi:hypothetical protein
MKSPFCFVIEKQVRAEEIKMENPITK